MLTPLHKNGGSLASVGRRYPTQNGETVMRRQCILSTLQNGCKGERQDILVKRPEQGSWEKTNSE